MNQIFVAREPVLVIREWLTNNLGSEVKVLKRRPNPTAGSVVVMRRIGGTMLDQVTDGPWVTLDIYGDDDSATSVLAHKVWGLLHAMNGKIIGGVQCYNVVTIAGPADQYDRDAELFHWAMTIQLAVRAYPDS